MSSDVDIVIWDTVGSEISEVAAKRPMGGSEYHLLQLTRALTERGFSVRILQENPAFGNRLGEDEALSCRVLVHSRFSRLINTNRVQADRVVVFATDMPGDATGSVAEDGGGYKHLSPIFEEREGFLGKHRAWMPSATLVCLSQWQLGLFPRAWQTTARVIPMMIDDRAYGLGRVSQKIPKRFL